MRVGSAFRLVTRRDTYQSILFLSFGIILWQEEQAPK